MKKILSLMIAAALLLCVTGCRTDLASHGETGGGPVRETEKAETSAASAETAGGAADPSEKGICTLSISCETILDHMDALSPGKEDLVPADGQILAPAQVEFQEGESVFDILQRETRSRKIHMEASLAAGHSSAYIEGIQNLYELDCGSESGWMYRVNGEFPSCGVGMYSVKAGDVIEFVYTCDLGRDVGDQYWDKLK